MDAAAAVGMLVGIRQTLMMSDADEGMGARKGWEPGRDGRKVDEFEWRYIIFLKLRIRNTIAGACIRQHMCTSAHANNSTFVAYISTCAHISTCVHQHMCTSAHVYISTCVHQHICTTRLHRAVAKNLYGEEIK